MKSLRSRLSALSLLVLGTCQTPAMADTSVSASGDPAKDVAAVQAAVDQGGIVTLHGTFDFGEGGQVRIRRDVEIVGVDDARINGGMSTLESVPPEVVPPRQPGPRIIIRNLHFDGASFSPIVVSHASALVVSGNRITNVRPRPQALPGFADGQVHAGIRIGPGYAQQARLRPEFKGVLTGRIVIQDNVIDMATPEPTRTLGLGVHAMWTSGADVVIERNTVSNASRGGIDLVDNYRDASGDGRIRVVGNRVTMPERGLAWPGPNTNAVAVGYFWDVPAAMDRAQSVEMEVADNQIEINGQDSRAVLVLGNWAKVRGNIITAVLGRAPLVWVAGSGVEVSANVFRGNGTTAVNVAPFRTLTGSGNRLVGNDLREFKASDAIVFGGGATDNLCTGHKPAIKVADYGLRNRCR